MDVSERVPVVTFTVAIVPLGGAVYRPVELTEPPPETSDQTKEVEELILLPNWSRPEATNWKVELGASWTFDGERPNDERLGLTFTETDEVVEIPVGLVTVTVKV